MGESYNLKQNNSYKITFSFEDEDGTAIPLASLSTIHCTLYYYNPEITTSDTYHLATINSRLEQDIKNTNDVAITVDGDATWSVQPEDTAKLNSATEEELHVALLTWYWGSGKHNNDELYFYIQKVPFAE